MSAERTPPLPRRLGALGLKKLRAVELVTQQAKLEALLPENPALRDALMVEARAFVAQLMIDVNLPPEKTHGMGD